jgi:hypothetical protein
MNEGAGQHRADYEPVDLSDIANGCDEAVGDWPAPWQGAVRLRGLPFRFADDARIVRLAPGQRVSIAVPSPRPCRTVTFAHRTADSAEPGLAPVGRANAVYRFTFAGGRIISAPVREGFEIAPPWSGDPHQWGSRPGLAVPDRADTRPDRSHGAFADFGRWQTQVVEAGEWPSGSAGIVKGWRFYLWSWLNPQPAPAGLSGIEMEALASAIEIGGICIGFADEHPLRPEPARIVVADVPPGYAHRKAQLAIDVDRGSAGYTELAADAGPDDPLAAWGSGPDADVRQVYARVSAIPSATVSLMAGDELLAQARWSQLKGPRRGGERLHITERGRNWVRTRIVDDETGEPMPCRVHFASPDGIPCQPHGHHHHVNGNLPSWHADVGSDVRLGRTTYAYVNGRCEGWLPRGPVRVQASRGFDYQPINELVTVADDTRELTLRLRRLFDPSAEGWYSGDTHVHFLSSFGALREAAAEGVCVVNLLLSQWGSLFTNTEDFLGRPLYSDDGATVVYASQENRQHFLGHLGLLGLTDPVMPWCTDGPEESEMGAGLEATLADWADRCHAQGGTVIIPHFPAPNGELAALIAAERADAVEFGELQERAFIEYYRYLNAGFRLPVAGGTDKMSNEVPIGLSRTYVRLDGGAEFSFHSWCRSLELGRSYMSSGPQLTLAVDGAGIGDTVHLPAGGGTVTVHASARSIFPMFRLEIILRGRVVASAESTAGTHELRLDEEVLIDDGPGWICARVCGGGPEHLTHHRDCWQRAIMAHSSPVYVGCGTQDNMASLAALEHTKRLVSRARSYVTSLAPADTGADVLHHHGGDHRSFLARSFDEADLAIERRIRQARVSRPRQGNEGGS